MSKICLDWCFEQDQSRLLELLAYLTAHTVSAVKGPNTGPRSLNAAERIAQAVKLDMGQHWKTSEAFFARLPKAQIAQAVRESGVERAKQLAAAIEKMKKGEAVTAAAEAMKGAKLLPAALQPQAIEDEERQDDENLDDEVLDDEVLDGDEDHELAA
jgi:ParB family transcriptional regulator, chromosome partitioning protein